MKLYLSVLAGALLLASAMPAATDPAGLWGGTLKTPNGDLNLTFNVHRDGDKWVAEMDLPEQGVSELPLNDVKVDGGNVTFSLPGAGEPRFEGKLSEDGKTIAGNFSQGGGTLPLELKWKSEPRAVAKAPANSGDVQVLEGVWEGTLDTPGGPLVLRFNFTKNADGTIKGTLDSVTQGANGLPVTSIARTADTIKVDVKVVSGDFEGALDKDAATMKGNWNQGGGSLPLTLQRKKAEPKK